MNDAVKILHEKQLAEWEMARVNYSALKDVRVKTLEIGEEIYRIQFNPARIISSSANIDEKSIQKRACFLCEENRPSQQEGLPFKEDYTTLVNPFPIFPNHLTIPEKRHLPQQILGRFGDMLDLAMLLDDFVVFYNGPKCGASAPDHFHFQAGDKGFMPVEKEWKRIIEKPVCYLDNAILWTTKDKLRNFFVIESAGKESAVGLFESLYEILKKGNEEPMMNILAWYDERWIICLFPRRKHRPSCYSLEGNENFLISPASVDLGGVFVVPLEKDFEKVAANDIHAILQEVCISAEEYDMTVEQIKRLYETK